MDTKEAFMPLDLFEPELLDPELAATLFTGEIGQILRHPLVHQVFYNPALNRICNRTLQQKKAAVIEASLVGDWGKYLALHEKPYRLQALWDIHENLTPEQYWPLLADIWVGIENQWQYKSLLPQLFRAKPKRYEFIMTLEERTILESYPEDLLTIYRGHQVVNAQGWSWTFSPARAEWFAKRLAVGRPHGVTRGTVKRNSIIAFFDNRNEDEVVVNPRAVKPTS